MGRWERRQVNILCLLDSTMTFPALPVSRFTGLHCPFQCEHEWRSSFLEGSTCQISWTLLNCVKWGNSTWPKDTELLLPHMWGTWTIKKIFICGNVMKIKTQECSVKRISAAWEEGPQKTGVRSETGGGGDPGEPGATRISRELYWDLHTPCPNLGSPSFLLPLCSSLTLHHLQPLTSAPLYVQHTADRFFPCGRKKQGWKEPWN